MVQERKQAADYVIVGAGSAGCVLANRLSADRDVNVTLIEAGGADRHPFMKLPMAFMKLMAVPRLNWDYWSEPEPFAGNRRVPLPRGRCLGGTSSINGMVYSRGHPGDYDEWADMGADGWAWDDVLPYFRRSEGNWRGDTPTHGGSGPLTVSPIRTFEPLYSAAMDAARSMGYPVYDDQHGPEAGEGYSPGDATVHRGERASTSKRYLDPVAFRPNLRIVTDALVQRIDMENGRAVGVTLRRNGQTEQIRANREVILSAGAYNSPQLLLLSGIGPADELRAHGITPVLDLPGVGRNLQEHPFAGVSFELTQPVGFERELRFDRLATRMARWYLGLDTGAVQLPVIGFGFIRTREGLNRPDVKSNVYPTRMDARVWFPGIRKGAGHALTVFNVLLRPESKGSVTLRSADPGQPPLIRLNLFEQPEDLATLRRAVRHTREFANASSLAPYIKREWMPGGAIGTDTEIEAHIRNTAIVAHHASCTCAMGKGPDAVVDPQLRVRGVEGLRVVDASVMPRVIGGNTNAPIVMIAEKAADLIRFGPFETAATGPKEPESVHAM